MLNHKHGETNKRQPDYAEDGSEEVELESAKPSVSFVEFRLEVR